MMENVLDFVNLSHPGVNTFCIYSLGIETPEKLVYNVSLENFIRQLKPINFQSGFPDSQPERLMGDGDGTVTKGSLDACRYFINPKSDKIRAFNDIKHGDILKHYDVFNYIKSLVSI